MTGKEEFMYQVMGKIYESGAPIVFKGAMITKLILMEGEYTALERQTRDIDANWVGTPPTMDELVQTINSSLDDFRGRVYAVPFRNYGEKISAGILIREKQTDEEIISMDIDMRPIHGSKIYHLGETSFRGVLVNSILADKITVLSSKRVFRRAKDIVDVYALSHCVNINTSDIYDIHDKYPDREFEGFEDFLNRKQDVKHAYDKLRRVDNKPLFEDVYGYLNRFIVPFKNGEKLPMVWNSDKQIWHPVPERQRTIK
jgi:hypothetical protein